MYNIGDYVYGGLDDLGSAVFAFSSDSGAEADFSCGHKILRRCAKIHSTNLVHPSTNFGHAGTSPLFYNDLHGSWVLYVQ